MTAKKNEATDKNRSMNSSAGSSAACAASETPNPSRFGPAEFSLAVIGVLTPFGVVQVVTTDRYTKALSCN